MITESRQLFAAILMLLGAMPAASAELRLSQGTNLTADVLPTDGRVVMDLLGGLWTVPPRGGDARRLLQPSLQASRPRWSPDGKSILFESRLSGGKSLWRLMVGSEEPQRLTAPGSNEHDGAWHPSGKRIVYAAATNRNGVDLWERDLSTGLSWRLTSHPGDESSPAWSADGRHLCYVLHERDRWYLMLHRFGQSPQVLHESRQPLHAPAWRPDNTLITFLARDPSGELGLNMVILSNPPLVRLLADGEDFFLAPATWLDRHLFLYTADGVIKQRRFEDRTSSTLPFSAGVGQPAERVALGDRERPLPTRGTAGGNIVVRASRMFDGVSAQYRHEVDIVIENGRIKAIEAQRNRDEAIVIDIGDTTVMPGLIDSYASLPATIGDALGPLLLTYGVTTLVSPDLAADTARTLWQSGRLPSPRMLVANRAVQAPPERDPLRVRLVSVGDDAPSGSRRHQSHVAAWRRRGVPVLATNWNAGLTHAADLLLGTAALPLSPAGRRYQDVLGMTGAGPLLLVSGLSDATTRGITALHPATGGAQPGDSGLRFVSPTAVAHDFGDASAIIVGSRPSGLPPGLATQAELLALNNAGLPPHRVLAAATSSAADALRAGTEIGRIAVGARADLILLAGDPLRDVSDISEVIAVVRDGHFYSAASLRDQAAALTVE